MEIKNLKLADLRLNPTNPREVVEEKYKQLIESILVFPKMLELRPVVHNARREVLGGNMRLRALQDIAQMSLEDIKARLECLEGYRSKPQAERVALLEFWQRWLDSPYAPAASADGLTDAEQQEFIIKDNLSFGKWDWEALANDWDEEQLGEWGLDVWQPKEEARDEGYDTDFSLPDGEKTGLRQVSFSFTDKQAEIVNFGLSVAQDDEGYQSFDKDGNDNENGSAMYYIVSCWLEDKMEEYGDIQAALEEFKPVYLELRTYLRNALKASGKTASYVDEVLGTAGMSGHYFGDSQWMFPTREAYEKMQMFMPLDRKWEDCTLIVHKYNLLDKLKKYGES